MGIVLWNFVTTYDLAPECRRQWYDRSRLGRAEEKDLSLFRWKLAMRNLLEKVQTDPRTLWKY